MPLPLNQQICTACITVTQLVHSKTASKFAAPIIIIIIEIAYCLSSTIHKISCSKFLGVQNCYAIVIMNVGSKSSKLMEVSWIQIFRRRRIIIFRINVMRWTFTSCKKFDWAKGFQKSNVLTFINITLEQKSCLSFRSYQRPSFTTVPTSGDEIQKSDLRKNILTKQNPIKSGDTKNELLLDSFQSYSWSISI